MSKAKKVELEKISKIPQVSADENLPPKPVSENSANSATENLTEPPAAQSAQIQPVETAETRINKGAGNSGNSAEILENAENGGKTKIELTKGVSILEQISNAGKIKPLAPALEVEDNDEDDFEDFDEDNFDNGEPGEPQKLDETEKGSGSIIDSIKKDAASTIPRPVDQTVSDGNAVMYVETFDFIKSVTSAGVLGEPDPTQFQMHPSTKESYLRVTKAYFSTLETQLSPGLLFGLFTVAILANDGVLVYRIYNEKKKTKALENRIKELEAEKLTNADLQQRFEALQRQLEKAEATSIQKSHEAISRHQKGTTKVFSRDTILTSPEYGQKRMLFNVDDNGFYIYPPQGRKRIAAKDRIERASDFILKMWNEPDMNNLKIKTLFYGKSNVTATKKRGRPKKASQPEV